MVFQLKWRTLICVFYLQYPSFIRLFSVFMCVSLSSLSFLPLSGSTSPSTYSPYVFFLPTVQYYDFSLNFVIWFSFTHLRHLSPHGWRLLHYSLYLCSNSSRGYPYRPLSLFIYLYWWFIYCLHLLFIVNRYPFTHSLWGSLFWSRLPFRRYDISFISSSVYILYDIFYTENKYHSFQTPVFH